MISRVFAKVVVAATSLLAFLNVSSFALAPTPPGTLTLAWDPSDDPTVAGYRLYQGGQSQVYTSVLDIGNATTATVQALVPGDTYYFAVTAYDATGLESAFSGEISYTVPTSTILEPNLPRLSFAFDPLGGAILSGTGQVGYIYGVLTTQDLVSWVAIGTVTINANGAFRFTDPVNSLSRLRFYRLEQIAVPPTASNSTAGSAVPLESIDAGL